MPVILKNNASSTLATEITASDTTLTVADGGQFPALSAGEYFYATLVSPAGMTEIIKVTARVSNSMAVERAQDGSSAAGFLPGALVVMRVNAASINDLVDEHDQASEISITDAGGYYTSTDVEGALQEAAQAATTQITDAGGYYTSTDVEGALQEAAQAATTIYTQGGVGAADRSVQSRLRDFVSVKDFGAVGDGVTDDTAAINAALAAAAGSTVYVPAGTYVVTSTLSNNLSPVLGAFGPAIRIVGDGMLRTFFDNRVANGPMIDIDSSSHGGSYEAVMGALLQGFTIKTTTSPANSDGVRILNGYEIVFDHIYIKGLTGNGIEMKNGLYTDDGWNMVTLRNCWLDSCGKWGIKADGSPARNEGSYTYLHQVFFQACGTSDYKTITNITQANPGVVTAAAHGFSNGDTVVICETVGMVEVNGQEYTVANATTDTFELSGANTTGFTAYGSGGLVGPRIPTSGGMIWKGQIMTMDQVAFANGVQNVCLFIKGDTGIGQTVNLRDTAFENFYRRGLYCTGLNVFKGENLQFYSNNQYRSFEQCAFDARSYTIRSVQINGTTIRATSGNNPCIAFKVSGVNAELNTCGVRNINWENFDYAGQTRFSGWKDRPDISYGKTGAQSVFNSPSAVLFDAVESDTQDCYNTSLGRYSAPYAGKYNVSGQLTLSGLAATDAVTISVHNTNTATDVWSTTIGASGLASESFPFNVTLDLGSGLGGTPVPYAIYASQTSGIGARALDVTSSYNNRLSVHRILEQGEV